MPKISKEKQEKIQEQILFHLFQIFPNQIFTSDIAKEIARDEEFIKLLMLDMEKKKLVIKIDKNSAGVVYLKRSRWRISNNVYEIYKKRSEFGRNFQNSNNNSSNPSTNSLKSSQEQTVYANPESKIEEKKTEDKTEEYREKSAVPNYIA